MYELLIIKGIIERGLLFSLVVIPVYLSSRIIAFEDLTVEGAFGIGGALMALMLKYQLPLFLSMPVVLVAGAACGAATGLLYTKLRVNNLIAGIVVTTALFSVSLKTAGANVAFSSGNTLFDLLPEQLGAARQLLILVPLVALLIVGVRYLLRTEVGYLLRAVGDNPAMLATLGKSRGVYKVSGLMLANSITALAGALFVQYVGYFSIWSNVGMLVVALAGLMLAETFSVYFGINMVLGAIAYQSILALTFECNVDQDWNKLITAVLVVVLIMVKNRMRRG